MAGLPVGAARLAAAPGLEGARLVATGPRGRPRGARSTRFESAGASCSVASTDSADLEFVCDVPPVFEPGSPRTQFVEASGRFLGSALRHVGSKIGIAELAELADDDGAAAGTAQLGLSSSRQRSAAQSLPNFLHLHGEAAPASNPLHYGRMPGPGIASSSSQAPPPALRINHLGLPGLLKRRSSRPPLEALDTGGNRADLAALQPSPSGIFEFIPHVIGDASDRRASILDFEHLFSTYYVEVTPRRFWHVGGGIPVRSARMWRHLRALRRAEEIGHRAGLAPAQPDAVAVAEAWKAAALEYIWEHRLACQQHWPQLRLSRAALKKYLDAELTQKNELHGPRSRVVLTLQAERVCHRLLWAVGDAFPPAQLLFSVEVALQAQWPLCRIRCSDDLVRPPNIFSFVLLILTLLLAWSFWGLWHTAMAVWSLPLEGVGKRPPNDANEPTREERLDQLAARVLICGSLGTFWLLHALAASFPLRSLHSPFKRDLGCLCAYSTAALRLSRLVAPMTAMAMPVAMAIRFDRLGLSLIVPMPGRPAGLHTAALLSASCLPVLTVASAWSVRSSLYSHHQLFIVLLFLAHLGSSLGFAAHFEMVKWAVLSATFWVIVAFYTFAKYASEFSSVSLVRAAKLQWACAHMVPVIGLLLAAALEVESGFARALVDFICENQDVIPTKMCKRMLRNA